MEIKKFNFLRAMQMVLIMTTVIFMSSCKKEYGPSENYSASKGEKSSVNFEFNTGNLNFVRTKAYSPSYAVNGFDVYAFRKIPGTSTYMFEKKINLANFSYSAADKKISGSDELTIGTYKFIPTYGLANQQGIITVENITSATALADDLGFSFNGSNSMNEIFLPVGRDASSLTEYSIGLDGTATTVSETIRRAVGRVDVMFIKAEKVGGEYIPQAYTGNDNVFNNRTVEDFRLTFTNINNAMTLYGEDETQTRSASLPVTITGITDKLTIGTNLTTTEIGEDGYYAYDNIQTNDLIKGSAHMFGTYLLPNDDNTPTTGLSVYFRASGVEGRTIPVPNLLPIEQNKITLVKIYVLSDYATTTGVQFEVELDTVWEDPNEVDVEISK